MNKTVLDIIHALSWAELPAVNELLFAPTWNPSCPSSFMLNFMRVFCSEEMVEERRWSPLPSFSIEDSRASEELDCVITCTWKWYVGRGGIEKYEGATLPQHVGL